MDIFKGPPPKSCMFPGTRPIILVCLYSAFLLVHRTQGALHNITPADLYIPEPSQLPGKHTRCSSLLGEHTQHSTISITVYSRVPILNTPGWSEETRSKVRFPSVHKATKRRVEPTTLRSRVQRATTRPLLCCRRGFISNNFNLLSVLHWCPFAMILAARR